MKINKHSILCPCHSSIVKNGQVNVSDCTCIAKTGDTMFKFLKRAGTLPLKLPDVELFLRHAKQMAMLGVITVYNWGYLAQLINYKVNKKREK